MVITFHDWLIIFLLFFLAHLFSGLVIAGLRDLWHRFYFYMTVTRNSAARQIKFGQEFERRCAVMHARNVRLQEKRNSQQ